ncbi:MAG: hypothetical protein ACI9FR_002554 [Cryomorphaceae bacterium]|jgi:hypothetical protein
MNNVNTSVDGLNIGSVNTLNRFSAAMQVCFTNGFAEEARTLVPLPEY